MGKRNWRRLVRCVRTGMVLLLAVGPALVLPFGPAAQAATTWTVTNLNDSGPGSLRQAIADAASGDTITFAAGLTGTITLTSGQLTIDRDLTIQGPGANALTVSGNNAGRVFQVNAGTVSISGLTIANGHVTGGAGGAIGNSGTLTLSNSTLSGNQADHGGGIRNNAGLTMTNSTLSSNTASYGGGILNHWNDGLITLGNTIVAGNTARSGALDVSGGVTSRGHNLVGDGTGSGGLINGSMATWWARGHLR